MCVEAATSEAMGPMLHEAGLWCNIASELSQCHEVGWFTAMSFSFSVFSVRGFVCTSSCTIRLLSLVFLFITFSVIL
jgi:hypothetical protein